jgi:putative toxin-antitoxin system antitoxin component (TIGR02293 family)
VNEIPDLERVAAAARDMLQMEARAEEWLSEPNLRLGGKSPRDMAQTSEGAQEVLALIGRIQHGVY